ncbi:DoxX family protein [Rhodopirellula sp. P2]|uniref:DoxX family protein n=1 Tax=Rhodopirellula sp. P2 TaxID=2127060 RepID=UPI00236893A0|nr:DoxX family protein [Rhodopirellula sp. P2]WDQ14837.1 DoxX family protein [Rhodopirellula sp. P2]
MKQRLLLGTSQQVSLGLLALRVAFGCFMLVHGLQKVMGFSTISEGFPDPLGMGHQLSLVCAIATEVGCSILLILGLGTRVAVAGLAFTMFVALFLVHGGDPWKVKELAAVYLATYAVIFLTGPGAISLDQKLFGKSGSEES